MPESINFDGEPLTVEPQHNDGVAVTEYELRVVASHMPGGRAVPVQVHGFDEDEVLVIRASGNGGLHALVALARLRSAVHGPQNPEPENGAQEAAQSPEEPTADRALSLLADDLQVVVEQALSAMEVDQGKYDVQNRAGDVVGGLLSVLRRHSLVGSKADEILNGPSGGRSLRMAMRDGYLTQRDVVARVVNEALDGRVLDVDRVLRALDKTLGR